MGITGKGFVLSLDLAFATIALLLMLFLIASAGASKSRAELATARMFGLEKNAFFIADSILKNSSDNALLGAALFDKERRSVKSGELNSAMFRNAVGLNQGEFFVKSVLVKGNSVKRTLFLQDLPAGDCIAVERFAIVDKEKAILEVAVCERQGNVAVG